MDKAIQLNGKILKGRNIIINESKRNITVKKKINEEKINNNQMLKKKISINDDNDEENTIVKKQKVTNKDFKKLFDF